MPSPDVGEIADKALKGTGILAVIYKVVDMFLKRASARRDAEMTAQQRELDATLGASGELRKDLEREADRQRARAEKAEDALAEARATIDQLRSERVGR
jgi:hypothetical protein